MARSESLLKIKGPLGNLSFYSSVYGDIVRRKGGATKEKIRKSPAFARLREHQAEFSACAEAGKLLRQALKIYTLQAPDHRLVWRVTKLMNEIKNLDKSSARGKRSVEKGLKTVEGKKLLRGYVLNSEAPMTKVLKCPVHAEKDLIEIKHLIPKRDLAAPAGATHVSFTGVFSRFDPAAKKHELQSRSVNLTLNKINQPVLLKPLVPTKVKGFTLSILLIRFYQETNEAQYILKNKTRNALAIMSVD